MKNVWLNYQDQSLFIEPNKIVFNDQNIQYAIKGINVEI